MASSPQLDEPETVLDTYRLHASLDVFAIGLFDESVTVLSQQSRALNLAWALTETGRINADQPTRVAIVGAGFAGLTVAAGLISKQADVEVTLLEQRDSVLPLQHGNDTRWLHPHIYDWPREGSSAHSAGLPLLNWTAARASDVVVQVRSAWQELRIEGDFAKVRLYCNAASVQVDVLTEGGRDKLLVEWIGQRRKAWSPSVPKGRRLRRGLQREFDIVILAIGFGMEADGAKSYWRNETLSQPALRSRRRTYVVSGVGDGGWIDLFRIRISDFRQDRILGELFEEQQELLSALREVQADTVSGTTLIPRLREIWASFPEAGKKVMRNMDQRLRHDTDAILHVREAKGFDALFNRRVSSQNQILAWVLHAVGGFSIWGGDIKHLAVEEHVSDEALVIRHGPKVDDGIQRVLGPALRVRLGGGTVEGQTQATRNRWEPGYFGTTLRPADDETKKFWKREYLPPSTEIVAASVCGAVAGALSKEHGDVGRLRITLHRVLQIGDSYAFQQCCDYAGVGVLGESKTAGRTFPLDIMTIGHAYRTRSIVRSRREAGAQDLQQDAKNAHLDDSARRMSEQVEAVLAIPLLAPAVGEEPGRIVAVLYADSGVRGFFAEDARVERVAMMCAQALGAAASEIRRAREISNFAFPGGPPRSPQAESKLSMDSLETVAGLAPPSLAFSRLNLDQTTFLEAERQ